MDGWILRNTRLKRIRDFVNQKTAYISKQRYNSSMHILLIVVRFGIYLAKINRCVCKNFRTEPNYIQIIANVPNDTNQETLLNLLGWDTPKVLRLKSKAKLMFKILHHMGPPSLEKLFNFKKESLHNLRDISNVFKYVTSG